LPKQQAQDLCGDHQPPHLRIQILAIEGTLNFRKVPQPPVIDTTAFKKARKGKQAGQTALDL
jgi:hypothetical protein